MLALLFLVLLFWVVYLFFGAYIKRWLMRRAAEQIARSFGANRFNGDASQNRTHQKPQPTTPPEEKVDAGTIAKRKFDKNQGEYVEFEDIGSSER